MLERQKGELASGLHLATWMATHSTPVMRESDVTRQVMHSTFIPYRRQPKFGLPHTFSVRQGSVLSVSAALVASSEHGVVTASTTSAATPALVISTMAKTTATSTAAASTTTATTTLLATSTA